MVKNPSVIKYTSLSLFQQATSSDAYLQIPGASAGIYGGGTLSDEVSIVDTSPAAVQSYGQPFVVFVNTYNVGDGTAKVKGFLLGYTQLPCGSNVVPAH